MAVCSSVLSVCYGVYAVMFCVVFFGLLVSRCVIMVGNIYVGRICMTTVHPGVLGTTSNYAPNVVLFFLCVIWSFCCVESQLYVLFDHL